VGSIFKAFSRMPARTLTVAACLLVAGVVSVSAQVMARPNALWFNKVISLERSRQLYVGLNANMWVMYDLPQAVLFQAWQGGTAGGAFVTGAPQTATTQYWFWNGTPQFPHVWRASGTSYFKDSVAEYFASYTNPAHINTTVYYAAGKWPKQPILPKWGGTYRSWSVRNASDAEMNAEVRFRAYLVNNATNVITLKFGLILPNNGGEVTVTESPEYSNLPSGNHLVRTFTFSDIPAGYKVRLEKLGGNNPAAWSVTSGSATIQGAAMVQTANGSTILNGSF
jgi:hypothetical protein